MLIYTIFILPEYGEAGIDWADLESPNIFNSLSEGYKRKKIEILEKDLDKFRSTHRKIMDNIAEKRMKLSEYHNQIDSVSNKIDLYYDKINEINIEVKNMWLDSESEFRQLSAGRVLGIEIFKSKLDVSIDESRKEFDRLSIKEAVSSVFKVIKGRGFEKYNYIKEVVREDNILMGRDGSILMIGYKDVFYKYDIQGYSILIKSYTLYPIAFYPIKEKINEHDIFMEKNKDKENFYSFLSNQGIKIDVIEDNTRKKIENKLQVLIAGANEYTRKSRHKLNILYEKHMEDVATKRDEVEDIYKNADNEWIGRIQARKEKDILEDEIKALEGYGEEYNNKIFELESELNNLTQKVIFSNCFKLIPINNINLKEENIKELSKNINFDPSEEMSFESKTNLGTFCQDVINNICSNNELTILFGKFSLFSSSKVNSCREEKVVSLDNGMFIEKMTNKETSGTIIRKSVKADKEYDFIVSIIVIIVFAGVCLLIVAYKRLVKK